MRAARAPLTVEQPSSGTPSACQTATYLRRARTRTYRRRRRLAALLRELLHLGILVAIGLGVLALIGLDLSLQPALTAERAHNINRAFPELSETEIASPANPARYLDHRPGLCGPLPDSHLRNR